MKSGYHAILDGIARGNGIGGPTALAEILAESLIECDGLDVGDVTRRYLDWWRSDAFDTGPTFARVFTCIDEGMEPASAVGEAHRALDGMPAGCSPAYRNSVLAACSHIPTDDLLSVAREEALITHFDPIAGDAATVVTLL